MHGQRNIKRKKHDGAANCFSKMFCVSASKCRAKNDKGGIPKLRIFLHSLLSNFILSAHIADLRGNMSHFTSLVTIATIMLLVATYNCHCENGVQEVRKSKTQTPGLWSALGCMITDDDITKCVRDRTMHGMSTIELYSLPHNLC
jgi:hypothetical protein